MSTRRNTSEERARWIELLRQKAQSYWITGVPEYLLVYRALRDVLAAENVQLIADYDEDKSPVLVAREL